ncbi:MAG TPA: class I SAM-dependent methyltransferase [Polyangiaceae bacterium]
MPHAPPSRRRTNGIASLASVRAHGGGALTVLRRLARAVGPLSHVVRPIERALERYTDWQSERFDVRHGTETHARVRLGDLPVARVLEGEFAGYLSGPICPAFFDEIVRYLPVELSRFTFVDVGAGKGRAVMLAHRHGFRRLVGLEFSADLITLAKKNVALFAQSIGRPVEVDWALADAAQYAYPLEPSVLFLNNPFPGEIADSVLTRIEASLAERPRPLVLAYRRPPPLAMARVDASPALVLHRSTPYWRVYVSRALA